VRDELGGEAAALARETDFLPFSDVEASVQDDVAFLRASPLIPPEIPIRGFVYDVRSGRLSEVAAQEAQGVQRASASVGATADGAPRELRS
jgi:carbonic anhydrase